MNFDETTILQTMKLPTHNQIPGLPKRVLQEPKTTIHDGVQQIGVLRGAQQSVHGGVYRYLARLQLSDIPVIEAVGEGLNKRSAERAAHFHLLAKMHEQELVASIWGEEEKIDKETMQEEKDAKLDIYIYAAKHGLVPNFNTETIKLLRRGGRKGFQVTIALPEQGIKVVAKNKDKALAEVSAAIKFKQEAEKYLSNGANQTSHSEYSDLNVNAAKSFFTWYKQRFSEGRFQVELENLRDSNKATPFLQEEQIGDPIIMTSKKVAEDVATLVAAVHVAKRNPGLLRDFFEVFRRNNNQIFAPARPLSAPVNDSAIRLMDEALDQARASGLGNQYEDVGLDPEQETARRTSHRQLSSMEIDFRSKELLHRYRNYLADTRLASLRQTRAEYPMNQYTEQVLDIIQKNLYSIIVGATGSGKTTQVPQILLNEATQKGEGGKCNIICTQPRRIAAKSVAQRVADERNEKLTNSVGYHVKRDPKLPRLGGSITYCTTGILSQQLQHSPDEVLDRVSHLIIDEVHERDTIIDFLLTTLKKIVAERLAKGKQVPHIVLMSATIDSEMFSDYFRTTHPQQGVIECPTLSVPGRTFPVKERHLWEILDSMRNTHSQSSLTTMNRDKDTQDYLEAEKAFTKENLLKNVSPAALDDAEDQEESVINWKLERGKALEKRGRSHSEAEEALVPHGLVATVIAHIIKTTQDGAILVFLPGLEHILKVFDIIRDENPLGVNFSDESKYRAFMLHSSIPDGQTDVFKPVPPGCRKIILATNIAETSITIPDVQHVVDTGKLRENQYDQIQRVTKLACVWVSKSNVKQRAGRAGRVQNGNYYALYPKERYQTLRAVGLPELLRSDLQKICLDVRAQGFKDPVKDFLAGAIEAPSMEAIDNAMQNLAALDCLTADEELTPLGRLLASLPIHPSLGKMIVLGVIYKCLDPLLVIGAAFNERNLFLTGTTPEDKRAVAASKFDYSQGTGSDAIACLNAFKEMRWTSGTKGNYALSALSSKRCLHVGAFKSILGTAETIASILEESQIIYATASHQRTEFQIGDPSLNVNSDKVGLVKALMLAGLYPNIGRNTRSFLYRTPGENNALVHPGSINAVARGRKGSDETPKPENALLSYAALAKSNDGNSIFMRETTQISPLMACLFGGHLALGENSSRIIRMDDWLPFFFQTKNSKATSVILNFRKGLETMQSQAFAALYKRALLVDNPVRTILATGLVDALDIDVNGSERSESGWDRTVGTWLREEGKKRTDEAKFAGNASLNEGHYNDWGKILDSWRPETKESASKIDRHVPRTSKLTREMSG